MNATPQRTKLHDALNVFVGKWTAHGISYGGTDQSGEDPKSNGETWVSTHEANWHTGRFFIVQDERADIAGSRFDTMSFIGVGDDGKYFSRSIENHGFYRDYDVIHEGDIWRFDGSSERATVKFEDGGRRQVWTWEWKPADTWLLLCDRIAAKID
ncbi:MAG: hypothetical protein CMN67_15100 [Sphingomonadaceae bacterium]|nr:hypothetical protein [Sphingomonadaceae bacterium]|tara:strand:- start:441 stop:905 length:465 start_codon:yes stop_codon:yes gene_type:complete